MFRKLVKKPTAIIGLTIILFLIIVALFAPLIAPNDPNAIDVTKKYIEPCSNYPLGTDQLGRCEFSRLVYGARYSLGIGVPVLLILSVISLLFGVIAANANKKLSKIIDYVLNVFISFPTMILGIIIISVLKNGISTIIIALVISQWAWYSKMVYSYAKIEQKKDYIIAARISGCGTFKIMIKHIIPNILSECIVFYMMGIGSAILMISNFSFLNLGLEAGTAEWGAMIDSAKSSIYTRARFIVYPGICIFVSSFGFALLGESLRDVLIPRKDGI